MRAGKVTSRQLVEAYLDRIRKYDKAGPNINAFIALNPHALETAAALDEERRTKGDRGLLHGIPIVVKDNYATEDMPTTAGSKSLEGFETHRDAFMVKKLREAGAVIVGKTNLHELAYGITTISSMGGQTRNPYDPTRNPGGSSGGTGAAVAASFAAAGMGTDTCGSIRIPSSNNSLFGLRGTMGLSSRSGIVPLSMTQDIGGPLARTVTDLAIMLDATVGYDADDPITEDGRGHIPRTYLSWVGPRELGDTTVGILTPLFGTTPEDEEVGRLVRDAVRKFADIGASVVEVQMPGLDDLLQGTSVINAEFKFDLLDFLKRYPNAPVHSLGEIIASGKYDPAIDGVLKRAEAVPVRESDTYARVAREAGRRAPAGLGSDGARRRDDARVSDAQAQSGADRSAAGGLELSVERDDRIPGDRHSGRLHERRYPGGIRTAWHAVQRAAPAEGGVCLGAGPQHAAAAEDHAVVRVQNSELRLKNSEL